MTDYPTQEELDDLILDDLADFESDDFDLPSRRASTDYIGGMWDRYGFGGGADGSTAKAIVTAHGMVQSFLNAFARGGRYQVFFDPTMRTAGTDQETRRVVVTPAPLLDPNVTPREAGEILTGLAVHEISHPRYGKDTTRAIAAVFKSSAVAHTLSNLLDDVRIEQRFIEDYPGYSGIFDAPMKYITDGMVKRLGGKLRPNWENLPQVATVAVRYPGATDWTGFEPERDWWQDWARRWSREDSPRRHVEAIREAMKHIVSVKARREQEERERREAEEQARQEAEEAAAESAARETVAVEDDDEPDTDGDDEERDTDDDGEGEPGGGRMPDEDEDDEPVPDELTHEVDEEANGDAEESPDESDDDAPDLDPAEPEDEEDDEPLDADDLPGDGDDDADDAQPTDDDDDADAYDDADDMSDEDLADELSDEEAPDLPMCSGSAAIEQAAREQGVDQDAIEEMRNEAQETIRQAEYYESDGHGRQVDVARSMKGLIHGMIDRRTSRAFRKSDLASRYIRDALVRSRSGHTSTTRYQKRGRLDQQSLHRIVRGDYRLFDRKRSTSPGRYLIWMLLDRSLSMDGYYSVQQAQVATAIADATRHVKTVRAAVWAWSDSFRGEYAAGAALAWRTGQPTGDIARTADLPSGGTPDATILGWAAEAIQREARMNEQPVILLCSDGWGDSSLGDRVEEARRKGILVASVAFGALDHETQAARFGKDGFVPWQGDIVATARPLAGLIARIVGHDRRG